MITGNSLDRSLWIGASDTYMVVGNPSTRTWEKWWATKTGMVESRFWKNRYTRAGDTYESAVLNAYGEPVTQDRTLLVPELSLRVNYDGDIPGKKIIEAKTYKLENGFIDKRSVTWSHYYMQVQVEMFAWRQYFKEPIGMEIRFYGLNDEDYEAAKYGRVLPIDLSRLKSEWIEYDEAFIEAVYLPKLKPLAEILKNIRDSRGDSNA